MKDRSHNLRRSGRGYSRRVLASNRAQLYDGDGEMSRDNGHRHPLRKPHTNWIVHYDGERAIVVGPSQLWGKVFSSGDDPFQAAIEYAAAELRKEQGDA